VAPINFRAYLKIVKSKFNPGRNARNGAKFVRDREVRVGVVDADAQRLPVCAADRARALGRQRNWAGRLSADAADHEQAFAEFELGVFDAPAFAFDLEAHLEAAAAIARLRLIERRCSGVLWQYPAGFSDGRVARRRRGELLGPRPCARSSSTTEQQHARDHQRSLARQSDLRGASRVCRAGGRHAELLEHRRQQCCRPCDLYANARVGTWSHSGSLTLVRSDCEGLQPPEIATDRVQRLASHTKNVRVVSVQP
jgi:hypothetical protein